MKRRAFLQNKLWRDKAVELMKAMKSIIHWQRLTDAEYDYQLKQKLLEEKWGSGLQSSCSRIFFLTGYRHGVATLSEITMKYVTD